MADSSDYQHYQPCNGDNARDTRSRSSRIDRISRNDDHDASYYPMSPVAILYLSPNELHRAFCLNIDSKPQRGESQEWLICSGAAVEKGSSLINERPLSR